MTHTSDKKDVFDTTKLTEMVNLDIRARFLDRESLRAAIVVLRMADTLRAALLRVTDAGVIDAALKPNDLTLDETVEQVRDNIMSKAKPAVTPAVGGSAAVMESSP